MKLFYFLYHLPTNIAPIVFINAIISLLLLGSLTAEAQAPTITSFTPTTICQGDVVTITGTDFTGATVVKLGTANATSFNINSATSITAIVSFSAGTGSVEVVTPNGTAKGLGNLMVNSAAQPKLQDISTLNIPFTNCDGNSAYTLIVINNSVLGNGGAPYKYDIDWGDGSTHFTQTDWALSDLTSHPYNSQGRFNIVFTITPSNGQCPKSVKYNFYNGTNPLASISTTTSTLGLCSPASLTFVIDQWQSNTSDTHYTLDFGDGTDTTLSHPLNSTNNKYYISHVYTKPSCPEGYFVAILTPNNGCITNYTADQINVSIKPKADFNMQQVCVNEQICFTNTTTNGYSGISCNTTSSFNWDFGDNSSGSSQTTPCHIYTTAGTYNVKLKASNITLTCGSDSIIKTIIVKSISPAPTISSTPIIYCQGETAVPLTATGTNLLWYTSSTGGVGSQTAPTPSTTNPGTTTYYVSQTINNNCESPRIPINVTVNAAPVAPAVNTPVELCQGQTAAPLTATGNSLLWYGTATGGTGSGTAPTPATTAIGTTTYYVSQIVNTCEGPRAAIVVNVGTLPGAPVIDPQSTTYCQNQAASPLMATGTNLLWYTTATGGTGSSTAPTPSTANVGTTTYYVSQSNSCGEGVRASITVTVNSSPSALIAYGNTVLCNVVNSTSNSNPPVAVILTGSTGGSFSINPSGGLSINATTGTLDPSGAAAGIYTITYTIPGTKGCTDFTTTAVVNVSGTLEATIVYPPICTSDSLVKVQLTGTLGGMFFTSTGLTLDALTGNIIPGTSTPGNYIVVYNIPASPPCPGFIAIANVTIAQASSAYINYIPANLCNAVQSNSPVKVLLTGTAGGSFAVVPDTGLLVDAVTGTISPAGATAGTYTITYSVAGSGGCANNSAAAIVTVNNAPTATISYPASPYCRGIDSSQPVSFSGSSGGTFISSPGLLIDEATGAINPSLSTAGIYTIIYTIPASPPCPGFITTTSVEIDEIPSVTFPVSVQSICSGGTAVFTSSSMVSNPVLNWSVAGTLLADVSGISSGIVSGNNASIPLSFINNSQVSQTIIIQVIPSLPNQSSCAGAPYNLTLTVHPIPESLATDTIEFCMHDPATALTVNASAGNTVNWYDQNSNLLNVAPIINTSSPAQFTYYASQTSSYGCESPKAQILTIVHPVAKIISASYTNPVTCGIPSGSVVLNVLDLNDAPLPNTSLLVHYTKFQTAYQVLDSTDATGKIVVPLTAGTYSDFYVETNGCASQKIPNVFVLSDPNPPAKPVAGYNAPLCSEDTLTLSALSPTSTQAGPINYVWVGPAFGSFADTSRNTVVSFPSVKTSNAGIYIVYAIQNNCISPTSSFQVTVKQSPSKPYIITRNPLCVGDNLSLQAYSTISGNNTLNYIWTGPGSGFPVNAPNAGIANVTIQDAGIYAVTVNSPQTGCSSTSDTLIGIGGYPVVQFARDTFTLPSGYLLNLAPVVLNAADPHILPMQQFAWTPAQNLTCNDAVCASPVATIKNNVCYAVKATNIYGCSGSDTLCIKVLCERSQVFIPNAFTPNGNLAENRKFMVRASGIASVKSFRVFNRWGQIVFERSNFYPNDPAFAWDGTLKGKPADTGVYIYIVEAVCENGVPYSYKGDVTLL